MDILQFLSWRATSSSHPSEGLALTFMSLSSKVPLVPTRTGTHGLTYQVPFRSFLCIVRIQLYPKRPTGRFSCSFRPKILSGAARSVDRPPM